MSIASLAFKGAQLALTAEMIGLDVDYTQVAAWGYRIIKTASKLQGRANAVDEKALAEMVELAQGRAPVRTGHLRLGITGAREGDVMVFKAEARRDKAFGKSGVDYAVFIEFGTSPGNRSQRAGVLDSQIPNAEQYFSAHPGTQTAPGRFFRSGRRLRRIYHPHPGTAARPFFHNSAREVLERRGIAQAEAIARAAAEDQDG